MENWNKIKEKYEKSILQNLDRSNFNKIIDFLINEKCDFIDDLVSDYLDLFSINFEEFIEKYRILNEKYNGEYLNRVNEDMNLLEEFYIV